MKKIFFILYLLIICISYKSSAQFLIGPQAGATFATLTGTSLSITEKPGWEIGTFISIPFSKHVSLIPALLYVVDGYKYDYTTTTTTNIPDSTVTEKANVNATLGSLNIPVMINYFTGETKGLMIQAGLQLSLLITDQSTITATSQATVNGTPQPSNPTDVNNVSVSKSDVSLIGGLGYKFSKLVIIYTRASTGFAKAQQGGFVKDGDTGHSFLIEGGLALSFGAE